MDINKINEEFKMFLNEEEYLSIDEIQRINLEVWDYIAGQCEKDEETGELYLESSEFREMIDDIMTEPDEYPETILDDLRDVLGSYYDDLLNQDISYVNFIYED